MPKPKNPPTLTYVNVNRATNARDKYKKAVDNAALKFSREIGKSDSSQLDDSEWKTFFKTVLIPLDKGSERHMIDLFKDDRDELNKLFILHNTLASNNIAEVYYKRYEKTSPTKWYDLDDFKQMALEGLSIAARKFDTTRDNKFITYATNWILNRVLHPNQEKGAFTNRTSLSAPISGEDGDGSATFEDVCTPDKILSESYIYDEVEKTPGNMMEKENVDESQDFYTMMKKIPVSKFVTLDQDKSKRMAKYLMSIIDKNRDSYNNRQIFLYLFKNIFNRCSKKFPGWDESKKMSKWASEAATSKEDLLKRLNMDDAQYSNACNNLMKGGYDGVQL